MRIPSKEADLMEAEYMALAELDEVRLTHDVRLIRQKIVAWAHAQKARLQG